MTARISTIVEESIALKREFFRRSLVEVRRAVHMVVGTLKGGGKLLIFGNGGSAADAQHIAAEFVNKFMMKRDALPAIALTTDTSVLTSVANDTDFSQVFSRQIEALGQEGDLAWGITTSGRSPNVVQGLIRAKQLGLKTLVLTGSDGGEVLKVADLSLLVPSRSTPRVQEVHIMIGHIICELVEEELFAG
ncbi:MAG: phosphoheptose isomerase [Deltaproteobacteria bacterium]|nr:MAG: phosphoheptose isomerase [Deltaproteobacteria bacterium]